MFSRKSLFVLLAFLLCFPVWSDAADHELGRPFWVLQQQINDLNRQVRNLAGRFSPPVISYTLPCTNAFSLTLNLIITDDKEIAYYAIQEQGGDPPANIITFVEPGLASVNYSLTIEPGLATRRFLLIATDTDGNSSKASFEIAPDFCYGP